MKCKNCKYRNECSILMIENNTKHPRCDKLPTPEFSPCRTIVS